MLLAHASCRSHNFGTLHGPMDSAELSTVSAHTDCVQVSLHRSHATLVSLQFQFEEATCLLPIYAPPHQQGAHWAPGKLVLWPPCLMVCTPVQDTVTWKQDPNSWRPCVLNTCTPSVRCTEVSGWPVEAPTNCPQGPMQCWAHLACMHSPSALCLLPAGIMLQPCTSTTFLPAGAPHRGCGSKGPQRASKLS